MARLHAGGDSRFAGRIDTSKVGGKTEVCYLELDIVLAGTGGSHD